MLKRFFKATAIAVLVAIVSAIAGVSLSMLVQPEQPKTHSRS
ncbi:MAG: hypothetical protein OFPI_39640 [Osedax symbiont Rs2]|nr:MAG: hypothetical protein OFPI_39640 [Osedax symbiont Rs2]